jgi:hypothetical protein
MMLMSATMSTPGIGTTAAPAAINERLVTSFLHSALIRSSSVMLVIIRHPLRSLERISRSNASWLDQEKLPGLISEWQLRHDPYRRPRKLKRRIGNHRRSERVREDRLPMDGAQAQLPSMVRRGSVSRSERTAALGINFGHRRLKGWIMLAIIAIVLIVLWLLGAFIVPVGGALIHILLVVGIIVLILHFVRGRSAGI